MVNHGLIMVGVCRTYECLRHLVKSQRLTLPLRRGLHSSSILKRGARYSRLSGVTTRLSIRYSYSLRNLRTLPMNASGRFSRRYRIVRMSRRSLHCFTQSVMRPVINSRDRARFCAINLDIYTKNEANAGLYIKLFYVDKIVCLYGG